MRHCRGLVKGRERQARRERPQMDSLPQMDRVVGGGSVVASRKYDRHERLAACRTPPRSSCSRFSATAGAIQV
eukprot:scaffold32856_cov74-Phaeocystis_antarctica.AAC.1